MTALSFRRLPIDPAEGFPQEFRLGIADRTYRFRLHANVAEELIGSAGQFELPIKGAFLVLAVGREEPVGRIIGTRRRYSAYSA